MMRTLAVAVMEAGEMGLSQRTRRTQRKINFPRTNRSGPCRLRGESMFFPHSHRRGWNFIQDDALPVPVMPKGKHAGRALLDTRGTPDALRILHGDAFVCEIHDVDSLVAN